MMRYDTRRSSSLIEMKNIKTAYKLYAKVFDLRLDLIFRSRMYSTRWRTFPETIFLLRLNGIFSYIALVHIYSFVSMFIFQVSGYLQLCVMNSDILFPFCIETLLRKAFLEITTIKI